VILRRDDDYVRYCGLYPSCGHPFYAGGCFGYDPYIDYPYHAYAPYWWRTYTYYDAPPTYVYPTYETYNRYEYYESPPPPVYGDAPGAFDEPGVPYDADSAAMPPESSVEYYPGERIDEAAAPAAPTEPTEPADSAERGIELAEVTPGVNAVIDEGIEAFAAGRFEEARRSFVRVSLEDRGDAYAMLLYGWTWFAVGDHEIAASAIRGALGYTPEVVHHPLDLRTLYGDEAALEGRLEQLGEFVSQFPANRQARFLLGYALMSSGRFQEALDAILPLRTPTSDDPITDSVIAALEEAVTANVPPVEP